MSTSDPQTKNESLAQPGADEGAITIHRCGQCDREYITNAAYNAHFAAAPCEFGEEASR